MLRSRHLCAWEASSAVQAEDGNVHFGDVVQLASADAKAVVAINIAEKVICLPLFLNKYVSELRHTAYLRRHVDAGLQAWAPCLWRNWS